MEEFPNELVKLLKPALNALKKVGFIFFTKQSLLRTYWRVFIVIPNILIFYLTLSFSFAKVFTGDMKFYELSLVIPAFVAFSQSIINALILLTKRSELEIIMKQFANIWRTDLNETQMYKRNNLLKNFNNHISAYYVLNVAATWVFCLAPPLEYFLSRFVLEQLSVLLLPFPCTYPYDPAVTWLWYIITYAQQFSGVLCLLCLRLGAEMIMVALCAQLAIEFALLQNDILRMKPVPDYCFSRSDASGFRQIVKRHQMLLTLSKQVDDVFNKIIFVNLLCATINICMFGFCAKYSHSSWDLVRNILAGLACTYPVFNLSFFSDQLTSNSVGIADAAYNSLWYKGGAKYRRSLCFLITRSQWPCSVTLLNYAPITLKTFTTVMSTSWSYFSLARTIYEDN